MADILRRGCLCDSCEDLSGEGLVGVESKIPDMDGMMNEGSSESPLLAEDGECLEGVEALDDLLTGVCCGEGLIFFSTVDARSVDFPIRTSLDGKGEETAASSFSSTASSLE